jgi:hypothetical protein
LDQGVPTLSFDSSQSALDFREGFLDGIEIGRVGRQVEKLAASLLDQLASARHSRSCVRRCVSRGLTLYTGMSISWHPCETAKICEIAFRALLTQDGTQQLEMVRA